MSIPVEEFKHRYKIEVSGTQVREYYEFDDKKTDSEVKEIWLSDVTEKWGDGVAGAFDGHIEVTRITDDEPPELP